MHASIHCYFIKSECNWKSSSAVMAQAFFHATKYYCTQVCNITVQLLRVTSPLCALLLPFVTRTVILMTSTFQVCNHEMDAVLSRPWLMPLKYSEQVWHILSAEDPCLPALTFFFFFFWGKALLYSPSWSELAILLGLQVCVTMTSRLALFLFNNKVYNCSVLFHHVSIQWYI